MSISADPMFVQAEVAYRRERLTAAASRSGARHHARRVRLALRGVRAGHRHGRDARHASRPA